MKSYEELLDRCTYAGGIKGYIGKTELGYPIPYLEKGEGEDGILLVGGIHAREFISSYLVLELFREECSCKVTCIPLLNIDGTLLSRCGLACVAKAEMCLSERDKLAAFLAKTNGSTDFSMWKANINAVDLNVNFPARWGEGRQNVTVPAAESYIGRHPLSESESAAMADFLAERKFKVTACYHSKGEEIYYGFGENLSDAPYALELGGFLKYNVKTTPKSCGGIKDYVAAKGFGCGFTVEVGSDGLSHPIGEQRLAEIYSVHEGSMSVLSHIASRIKR